MLILMLNTLVTDVVVVRRHILGTRYAGLFITSLKSTYRAPPEGTATLNTVILALEQYITAVSCVFGSLRVEKVRLMAPTQTMTSYRQHEKKERLQINPYLVHYIVAS